MTNPISPIWGKKIGTIDEIYKGDGVATCKWCGDTGYMHTFSLDGYFYNDAPCICPLGQTILNNGIGSSE